MAGAAAPQRGAASRPASHPPIPRLEPAHEAAAYRLGAPQAEAVPPRLAAEPLQAGAQAVVRRAVFIATAIGTAAGAGVADGDEMTGSAWYGGV